MFFETIKLIDGHMENLSYHQERMNRTLQFHYPDAKEINLKDLISITEKYTEGIYKVRVDYDIQISQVSIDPYQIKAHHKLKIIEASDFNYTFKFADRNFFASQLNEFPDCDDILFTQNGFLTDTTYCNIALFDGKDWLTPATYLLPGTKRSQLLTDKKITEQSITLQDLGDYQEICFLNAMRDFEKRYTFVINQDEILLNANEH